MKLLRFSCNPNYIDSSFARKLYLSIFFKLVVLIFHHIRNSTEPARYVYIHSLPKLRMLIYYNRAVQNDPLDHFFYL